MSDVETMGGKKDQVAVHNPLNDPVIPVFSKLPPPAIPFKVNDVIHAGRIIKSADNTRRVMATALVQLFFKCNPIVHSAVNVSGVCYITLVQTKMQNVDMFGMQIHEPMNTHLASIDTHYSRNIRKIAFIYAIRYYKQALKTMTANNLVIQPDIVYTICYHLARTLVTDDAEHLSCWKSFTGGNKQECVNYQRTILQVIDYNLSITKAPETVSTT